jgi:hypothetical protein
MVASVDTKIIILITLITCLSTEFVDKTDRPRDRFSARAAAKLKINWIAGLKTAQTNPA